MVHRVNESFHDRETCFVIHVTDWRDGLPAVVVLSVMHQTIGQKGRPPLHRDGLNLVGVL